MADLNSVSFTGRLTRDPELRKTTTGKSVTSFSIAVGKRFKRDGDADADFFRCQVWGQSAEFVAQYGSKGRRVAVSGRLDTRKYNTQEGEKREVIEIVCDSVDFMDSDPNSQGSATAQSGQKTKSAAPVDDGSYDPFADE